ncbi:MAG: hypothetical protein K0Q63_2393 [Paenibacillus sp.]|nr:hypothetical protein [Paenibacillus sp.]
MKVKVLVHTKNKERTACNIRIKQASISVYCNGGHEFELSPGLYEIEAFKGKLYIPARESVEIRDQDVVVELILEEMIDTKALGLYSFDAHSHVSRKLNGESADLELASVIMKAEDFNFFFAGSPYNLETHMQDKEHRYNEAISYREQFSDTLHGINGPDFLLDIGNEIVKCRYGHMFLMNFDQKPPFSRYYDLTWDPWQFAKAGDEPAYCIPYPYEALGKEKGRNSVAVAAHPTSWWYHNGEFITNIASTLGFELLAGSVDAMVIMGYDRDHLFYQRLWYDALNNGFFLPGVAETDHTFDAVSPKHLQFKTYTHLEEFSIHALCSAVKAGRNFVSSGPILLLKVNDALPGTVFGYTANEEFRVDIEAFRCYQAPLSKIQLIVNGEIWKEYDMDDDRFELSERLTVNKDSYILAKCYDGEGNVAIANPVYIRNAPFVNKGFKSELKVSVMKDGEPADGLYWTNHSLQRTAFSKELNCIIPVSAEVNIEVAGVVRQVKLFEMDELQAIFKDLYVGHFNADRRYAPGEVPAEYFQLARIQQLLNKVHIEIRF